MKTYDISVVIPVFNMENFLEPCLVSITEQSLQNIEVIIVNDGSTDNSLEICNRFANKDQRLKVINQKNSGSGAARNVGIENAEGKYIAFVDPDDLFFSRDSLKHLYEGIGLNDADMCGGNVVSLNGELLNQKYSQHTSFDAVKFYQSNYIPNQDGFFWRFLYKKSFLIENNILFPEYLRGQDTVFLMKCFDKNPKIQVITESVYTYRILHKKIYWDKEKLIDFLDALKQVLLICQKNQFCEIIYLKLEWLKTQWEEIIRECEIHEVDLFSFVESLDCFLDWDLVSSAVGKKVHRLERGNLIFPVFRDKSISIVLCADENYLSFMSVTIQSIIQNSSIESNYDIVVLNSKMSVEYRNRIESMVRGRDNISIRFYDIDKLFNVYDDGSFHVTAHFSKAAYYRFFIPVIFKKFKKVLYLDSDLLVLGNLQEVFDLDMEEFMIAAAPALGPISGYYKGDLKKYFEHKLNITNPNKYFNSGVMLFNIDLSNKNNLFELLIQRLKVIDKPFLVDQDIFNSVCNGAVKVLPQVWNLTTHLVEVQDLYELLPISLFKDFVLAKANPKIIHFTSSAKPWNSTNVPYGSLFWNFARNTPFYEDIIIKEMRRNISKNLNSSVVNKINFKKRLKIFRYKIMKIFVFGKNKEKYKQKILRLTN